MKNILVCCWLEHGIQMLIPKQRGEGFLKVPAGHHAEEWLSNIDYDICGLDGHLDIACDCHPWEREKRDVILEKIMPVITGRFNFPWRVVTQAEFGSRLR